MAKVFEMFGEEGKGGRVSKDKLGEVLRLFFPSSESQFARVSHCRALGENPTEDEVKELESELCSKDG